MEFGNRLISHLRHNLVVKRFQHDRSDNDFQTKYNM